MRKVGILTLGIASGGLLLGLLLGSAVMPEMKEPPAPSWQQDDGGNLVRSAPDRSAFVSMPPRADTARSFGGYRPDLDYTSEVWSPRLPDYELAPLSDEYDAYFAHDDPRANRDTSGAEEAADNAHDDARANRDTSGAEEAADNARAAVEEARAADHAPAASEVRKSELARTGLY